MSLVHSPMPPGYSIPVVDLDDEASSQIIIDKEPGQYLGHPTTVLLEDNLTMIIVYPKGHLWEPGLIRSPDGNQIAMLLRENTRSYNSFIVFSDDEGETWSSPRELPAAPTGDRHTLRYAPDGRIFAVFLDQAHVRVTRGDFVAWVGTYDDLVEGVCRIRLKDNKSGIETLPDGTFIATTYGHWDAGELPYILDARILSL